MCGIAGIVLGVADNWAREDLHRVVQALSHRGPDGTGFFFDEAVWLGHQRLSIIDPAGGAQPMFNEDQSIAVVCNGEIYNFQELKHRLEQKGHRFGTSCDTEVIPHLYEEYGVDFPEHLVGMFAIAVWDRRVQRLMLVRDRMGIKPLYYAETAGGLVFASELRAVLAAGTVPRDIDPDGVSEFLTYDATPAPRTILRAVRKLPAASRMVRDASSVRLDEYWGRRELYPPVVPRSLEEAAEQLRALLRDVVRRHLISDVPLGVFLSGGIDSSYIAAVMAEVMDEPLRTFSIAFDEESFDEGPYARMVAAHLGTEHHEERLPVDAALQLLPRLPDIMDEPLGDPAILPTYLLSRAARTRVVVALSGEGGDELFYGYPTYYAHRVARLLERSPRIVSGAVRALVGRLPASSSNFALDFVAKRFASGVGRNLAERHAHWMSSFEPDKESLLTPEFYTALEDPSGLGPARRIASLASAGVDPLLVASHLDLVLYLQDGILMRTDKASMANALEVRVPFLDHQVVEFARALPTNLKLRGRVGKYLLRWIARDRLPADIVRRPKKGFGVPVAGWFRGELRELLADVLSAPRLRAQGIFQPEAVTRLVDEHQKGRQNHRKALWALLAFQLWHDRFGHSVAERSEPVHLMMPGR